LLKFLDNNFRKFFNNTSSWQVGTVLREEIKGWPCAELCNLLMEIGNRNLYISSSRNTDGVIYIKILSTGFSVFTFYISHFCEDYVKLY